MVSISCPNPQRNFGCTVNHIILNCQICPHLYNTLSHRLCIYLWTFHRISLEQIISSLWMFVKSTEIQLLLWSFVVPTVHFLLLHIMSYWIDIRFCCLVSISCYKKCEVFLLPCFTILYLDFGMSLWSRYSLNLTTNLNRVRLTLQKERICIEIKIITQNFDEENVIGLTNISRPSQVSMFWLFWMF